MRQTIVDIKIGDEVHSPRNGKGMITGKTKRTVTATFMNGNICKNTYKNHDDYFYHADF